MITELSVEKCGGYRWCVPSESTNAEYFVQWLFTLWKQIVMFNSCILMYTCTVRLMRGLGFYWVFFFFIKLLFLLSVFLQILELLYLHVWKFHVLLLLVFRNWRTLFFTTNVCMFLLSFLAILYYVAQFYYEFVKLMLRLSVSW